MSTTSRYGSYALFLAAPPRAQAFDSGRASARREQTYVLLAHSRGLESTSIGRAIQSASGGETAPAVIKEHPLK
eukprot:593740-Pyramimonas_sp.AAC.1